MTISSSLKHCGMENVVENCAEWTCTYKGNNVRLSLTNGSCDWFTFTLYINDKLICTRCSFRTLIKKIKSYK